MTKRSIIKYAVFIAAMIFILPAKGQTSTENTQQVSAEAKKDLLKNKWDNALGSFQFQITDSRINPQIDISVIEDIEKKRDADKVIYLDYKENIKIMILPVSAIKGEYEKLTLFKYISSLK